MCRRLVCFHCHLCHLLRHCPLEKKAGSAFCDTACFHKRLHLVSGFPLHDQRHPPAWLRSGIHLSCCWPDHRGKLGILAQVQRNNRQEATFALPLQFACGSSLSASVACIRKLVSCHCSARGCANCSVVTQESVRERASERVCEREMKGDSSA
ncbi:unnamed protein product [Symbiodinium sp. CCMP2456]|nr:unnamed protein product [Symbiodinium sp. CCMP2456]